MPGRINRLQKDSSGVAGELKSRHRRRCPGWGGTSKVATKYQNSTPVPKNYQKSTTKVPKSTQNQYRVSVQIKVTKKYHKNTQKYTVSVQSISSQCQLIVSVHSISMSSQYQYTEERTTGSLSSRDFLKPS